MPLSSLVDKVLESKAKELLPKINDIVEKLRETKNRQTPPTKDTSLPSEITAEKNTQEVVSKAKPTDFGSLPLPIDIPGLTSSTSGSNTSQSTKKESIETKPTQKSKSKPTDGCSAKESKTKGKSNQQKLPTTTKEPLKKEKELVVEKETSEEAAKERDKHKATVKQKKVKDEVKEKGGNLHKEKSQDSKLGAVEKQDQEAQLCKSDNKIGKSLAMHQQQQLDNRKDLTVSKSECADQEVQSHSKKTIPPRRRSARIASLSESVEDKEEGESDEHHRVEDKTCDKEAVNKGVNEGIAKTKSSGSLSKRKRKQMKLESQKKRQRLLSSSSDEVLEIASSDEESDYGSVKEETRKVVEDKKRGVIKRKSKQTDSQLYSAQPVKKSRKRLTELAPKEEAVLVPQKRPRRLSKTSIDSSNTQAVVMSSDHEPAWIETDPKPHRRKSSQPHRLPVRESKSPPVVVTRYNRQIKPNRRYLDNSGGPDEIGNELDDEMGEVKMSTQDSKDLETYSDIDSSESA